MKKFELILGWIMSVFGLFGLFIFLYNPASLDWIEMIGYPVVFIGGWYLLFKLTK
jgi:hypothetical protein